jgi:hypothetical protein
VTSGPILLMKEGILFAGRFRTPNHTLKDIVAQKAMVFKHKLMVSRYSWKLPSIIITTTFLATRLSIIGSRFRHNSQLTCREKSCLMVTSFAAVGLCV